MPLAGDRLRHLLGVLARAAVHDRRRAPRRLQHVQQRRALARDRALAFHRHHVEREVRPVEARAHRDPLPQPQPRARSPPPRAGSPSPSPPSLAGDPAPRSRRAGAGSPVGSRGPTPPRSAPRPPRTAPPGASPAPRGTRARRSAPEPPAPAAPTPDSMSSSARALWPSSIPDASITALHPRLLQPLPLVGHQRDQRAHDHHQPAPARAGQLVAERLARRPSASPPGCRGPRARPPPPRAGPGGTVSRPKRFEQLLRRRRRGRRPGTARPPPPCSSARRALQRRALLGVERLPQLPRLAQHAARAGARQRSPGPTSSPAARPRSPPGSRSSSEPYPVVRLRRSVGVRGGRVSEKLVYFQSFA